MLNRASLPLVLLCSALLAACASQPTDHVGSLPEQKHSDIDKTLALAERKKGPEALNLQLRAAELAQQQGDLLLARTLLDAVDLSSAMPAQIIFANTLAAELALARQQPEQALQLLADKAFERISELPVAQQARSHLARAAALEDTGKLLAAARVRIFTAPYLSGETALDNHEHIWSLVSNLPSGQYQTHNEPDLTGWLELARITKSTGSLEQKQAEIRQWTLLNPQHPASLTLPKTLQALQQLEVHPIQRIALLLPSNDPNQNVVNALRNGFLSAYYHAQKSGQQVPELLFFDSSSPNSLSQFYQQLQQQQVDLLVGPWEKDLVTRLAEQPGLPVTTLALNYADSREPSANRQLFQFGLAAEDEARMVAERAWSDGKRNAIVLVQPGDWGRRIQNAFGQHWQQLGGHIAAAQAIGQPTELAQQLGGLLKLRDSEARHRKLQNLLGTSLHFQPSRRSDVDFIFLAAAPQQAQQIQPTLRFQYAGDLPIYATSAVNPSSQSGSRGRDLEGILLTEIPWLLEQQNSLRDEIGLLWPEANGIMGRFYAMGADAYQLALQLQQLKALPNNKTEGFTGSLQLNAQQHIERTPYWAKIVDGKAVLVLEDEQP